MISRCIVYRTFFNTTVNNAHPFSVMPYIHINNIYFLSLMPLPAHNSNEAKLVSHKIVSRALTNVIIIELCNLFLTADSAIPSCVLRT